MGWSRYTKARLETKEQKCKEMFLNKAFIRYVELLIEKEMNQKFDPRIPKSYLVDLILKLGGLSRGLVMTDSQFKEAKGIFAFYKKVSEEEDFPIKK